MTWLWNEARPEKAWWPFGPRLQVEPLAFSARLPSRDEGLWFSAEFTLKLEIDSRTSWEDVASAVRVTVLDRARKETRAYSVADAGSAEAALWRRLLTEEAATEPGRRLHGITVELAADEADAALVRERERYLARDGLDAEEHRCRMRRLQRLTDDVYSDSSVALRWWYDHNPHHIRDLDTAAERLRLMAPGPEERAEGPPAVESAGMMLSDLLQGIPGPEQAEVVERLALLFSGFGRRDLAKRLRAEFREDPPSDPSAL